jgi:FAD/FMN-containing dehydrogenase
LQDFGGIVTRTPRWVARPGSVREVAATVRDAGAGELVPRGTGHSTYGQSQTDGISLDLRGLRGVRAVRGDAVEVEAGATWREVLDATLPSGLTPPVLPDHLDMTVGGTISAGGVGGTSHVHATVADTTRELEVVTAEGEIARCSATHRRALFDAVRGGLGRHGVITAALVALVPAPRRVLSCRVPVEDAAALLRAQRLVAGDHLAGQAKPATGGGWRFELRATVYDGDAAPPGTSPTEIERLSYLEFVDRLRPDVEQLVALGEWARPHPWGMVFLPADRAAAIIEATLATMGPADLGLSGVVLVKALTLGRVPALAAPPDPVLFGLLRTASPGCATVEEMLAGNRILCERARQAGGTRYAVDAVPGRTG